MLPSSRGEDRQHQRGLQQACRKGADELAQSRGQSHSNGFSITYPPATHSWISQKGPDVWRSAFAIYRQGYLLRRSVKSVFASATVGNSIAVASIAATTNPAGVVRTDALTETGIADREIECCLHFLHMRRCGLGLVFGFGMTIDAGCDRLASPCDRCDRSRRLKNGAKHSPMKA
jgi:hypothetical protein